MKTIHSALDGLRPPVRFAVITAATLALTFVVALLLLRMSSGSALGIALAGTLAGVGTRAYQVRSWPWRSPGVDHDST